MYLLYNIYANTCVLCLSGRSAKLFKDKRPPSQWPGHTYIQYKHVIIRGCGWDTSATGWSCRGGLRSRSGAAAAAAIASINIPRATCSGPMTHNKCAAVKNDHPSIRTTQYIHYIRVYRWRSSLITGARLFLIFSNLAPLSRFGRRPLQ